MKDHSWISLIVIAVVRGTIRLKAAPLAATWDPLVPIVPPIYTPADHSPLLHALLSGTERPSRSQVLILNSNMLTSYFYISSFNASVCVSLSEFLFFFLLFFCVSSQKSPALNRFFCPAKIIAIIRVRNLGVNDAVSPKWLLNPSAVIKIDVDCITGT